MSNSPYQPDQMRARFHELNATIKAIEAKAAPHRQQYDDLSRAHRQQMSALEAALKEIEAPLYDLKVELAVLARALGNKVGEPPGT